MACNAIKVRLFGACRRLVSGTIHAKLSIVPRCGQGLSSLSTYALEALGSLDIFRLRFQYCLEPFRDIVIIHDGLDDLGLSIRCPNVSTPG